MPAGGYRATGGRTAGPPEGPEATTGGPGPAPPGLPGRSRVQDFFCTRRARGQGRGAAAAPSRLKRRGQLPFCRRRTLALGRFYGRAGGSLGGGAPATARAGRGRLGATLRSHGPNFETAVSEIKISETAVSVLPILPIEPRAARPQGASRLSGRQGERGRRRKGGAKMLFATTFSYDASFSCIPFHIAPRANKEYRFSSSPSYDEARSGTFRLVHFVRLMGVWPGSGPGTWSRTDHVNVVPRGPALALLTLGLNRRQPGLDRGLQGHLLLKRGVGHIPPQRNPPLGLPGLGRARGAQDGRRAHEGRRLRRRERRVVDAQIWGWGS